MKILGIDPGMAIVGYSLVEFDGEKCMLLTSGSVQTQKGVRESARLLEIYNDMTTIIEKYTPDVAAIEKLFFFRNRTTVMPVAHARGVILTVLLLIRINFQNLMILLILLRLPSATAARLSKFL